MDRYKCMEAFVHVAETGSLTGAARNLAVSKSTISERLSQLEQLLATTLVYRSTRTLRLTSAGRVAYAEFAQIVARLEDAERVVTASGEGSQGSLRVATAVDLGTHELGLAMAQFRIENPRIAIDMTVGDQFVDPVDSGLDIVFHYRNVVRDNLRAEVIAKISCGLYAAPSYLAQNEAPCSPGDLTQHSCLGYLYQKAVHDWIPTQWNFERGSKAHKVRVSLGVRSNSSTVLQHFAKSGAGLAILPKMRAYKGVDRGELVEVLADWRSPSLTLYATYPRTLMRSQKILRITRFVRSYFSRVAAGRVL